MNSSEEKIVAQALEILSRELRTPGAIMSSPSVVKNYLKLHLATQEREVFGGLWLDVRNSVIAVEDMFFGSLTSAAVYPREVVKSALAKNVAALICFHNHPSGHASPSAADIRLTQTLKEALQLIDVRLLDHIIVGGMSTYSFAENGEI